MKTVETLCRELLEDQALFAALEKSVKTGKVENFLRAQDCGASPAELKAGLKKRTLSDRELEAVSGGFTGDLPEDSPYVKWDEEDEWFRCWLE